jgi:hypothetical protein
MRSPLIRLSATPRRDGARSLRAIARELSARKIRTASGAAEWSAVTVSRVLDEWRKSRRALVALIRDFGLISCRRRRRCRTGCSLALLLIRRGGSFAICGAG